MGLASWAVSADYFRGTPEEHEPHAVDAAGRCGGSDIGQESSLHALPVVECPGCRTKMQVVGTEPAPNEHSVTYRCDRCGTEQCAYSRYPMNSDGAPSPTR